MNRPPTDPETKARILSAASAQCEEQGYTDVVGILIRLYGPTNTWKEHRGKTTHISRTRIQSIILHNGFIKTSKTRQNRTIYQREGA